jgi:hypothetical protein
MTTAYIEVKCSVICHLLTALPTSDLHYRQLQPPDNTKPNVSHTKTENTRTIINHYIKFRKFVLRMVTKAMLYNVHMSWPIYCIIVLKQIFNMHN